MLVVTEGMEVEVSMEMEVMVVMAEMQIRI
jgi:hypothetical protein